MRFISACSSAFSVIWVLISTSASTGVPTLSSRKLARRYSAPPLSAPTRLPSRPAARVFSNSTGTVQVGSLRPFSRARARSAA